MNDALSRRRVPQEHGRAMIVLPHSQGGLRKALAELDEYDAEWEDEDDDDDYDSGLGSSSGSDTPRLQHLERRKRHLKMSRRLILRQSSVVDLLGGRGDPFAALPDTIGGSDMLVHHCKSGAVF
jgi:hypothetical protein